MKRIIQANRRLFAALLNEFPHSFEKVRRPLTRIVRSFTGTIRPFSTFSPLRRSAALRGYGCASSVARLRSKFFTRAMRSRKPALTGRMLALSVRSRFADFLSSLISF